MADFTALNAAVSDLSGKVDALIASQGSGAADQAAIDTVTANIAAISAKIDAAGAPPVPTPPPPVTETPAPPPPSAMSRRG